MTEQIEQSAAHLLAPGLDGEALLVAGATPPDRAAAQQVAHHAARAWAFLLAASPTAPHWSHAVDLMILEYRAAMMLYRLEVDDAGELTPDELAVEIETDLASPHVLPTNIVRMLAWVGLNPNLIAAYQPPDPAPPAEAPLDVVTRMLASASAAYVETQGPAQVYDRVVELVAEYRKLGGR